MFVHLYSGHILLHSTNCTFSKQFLHNKLHFSKPSYLREAILSIAINPGRQKMKSAEQPQIRHLTSNVFSQRENVKQLKVPLPLQRKKSAKQFLTASLNMSLVLNWMQQKLSVGIPYTRKWFGLCSQLFSSFTSHTLG